MSRRRVLAATTVALVLLAVLAGNAQYVFLSTYRAKNDSGPESVRLVLRLEQVQSARVVRVADIRRDASRTGWLRFRGEASLRAEVEAPDGRRSSCATYIESGWYHADVNVNAAGEAECSVRVVSPLELGLANVIP